MAETTQLTRHIESYVDVSCSSDQQGAGLDSIVALLNNDVITISSLVRDMEMYLTTTDNVIRARGTLLLGEALMKLCSKPLESATVHSLMTFFAERLADWRALRGALVGCLALMRRNSCGVVNADDAVMVAKSYIKCLQVQSLAQHDRKLSFELLECLLERHPHVVTSVPDFDFVYKICEDIDGEKDPQCLMLTFHIVELLVKAHPVSSGPVSNDISELFNILSCYFPIHFTHPKAEDGHVGKDDLSTALMMAFSATPLFEPFVVPLLLEKLSSSLPSAKVDSLKFLNYCAQKYGRDRMAKHAIAIWSSLKDTIYTTIPESPLSFTTESLDSQDAKENEIFTEAFGLLEKIISLDEDNGSFVSLIIGDDDINTVFNTVSSYNSYEETPIENKQKLLVIGHILYVSARSSISSCKRIVECFLPRLLEDLELSLDRASRCFDSNSNVLSRKTTFGSLYLSIELLKACRDLGMNKEDLAWKIDSQNGNWCRLLQCLCGPLSGTLSSILVKYKNEPENDVYLHLAVRGLEVLALLPGVCLLIPDSTFEDILVKLVSIVVEDSSNIILWRLALKALVHIATFIHKSDEPDKQMRYMNIVVEKFVPLVSSIEFNLPFPLKLEALSHVSRSNRKYMLRILLQLEEVISTSLIAVYVEGNLSLAKTTCQLLECYSSEMIPWMQTNEGSEEVLLKFVFNIWKTIEDAMPLTIAVNDKELLDAMIKVMKLSVACCSVDSQNIIVDKAYSAVSTITSFPLKESSSILPVKELKETQVVDKLSNRDELVLALFASVIIGLHPQAQVPNLRAIAHLFSVLLFKDNVTAAQAYGSLVNKLNPKSKTTDDLGMFTIEQAVDVVLSKESLASFEQVIACYSGSDRIYNGTGTSPDYLCLGPANHGLRQTHAIAELAWIGKGLLMRGHERVKDVVMVLLKCLLDYASTSSLPLKQDSTDISYEVKVCPSVAESAADAFQILISDSDLCLNRKFHATVRPIYKQRFFSTMRPILESLIVESKSSFTRRLLYRAFVHVISDTPLVAILNDAGKLVSLLVDGISSLSKDASDKDVLYSLLLVLSGILTDNSGQEAVLENAHILVNCLVDLIMYPHRMLVRETAIQCLTAMSQLPYAKIYPRRVQVLQAVSKALDDPKRVVRQEAVKCRQAWGSIA
ncbi:MMS19 nucleotide excision repair protein homolog [Linum perenne]